MKQPTDLVKYEFDPANPPILTDQQRVGLAELAALPDMSIDYSDISATDEAIWKGAQVGRFCRPKALVQLNRLSEQVSSRHPELTDQQLANLLND